MGLDMYACILEKAPPSQVDFKDEGAAQLHYWRKHPNLTCTAGWSSSTATRAALRGFSIA
jgi:hypothetical protein